MQSSAVISLKTFVEDFWETDKTERKEKKPNTDWKTQPTPD